MEENAKNHRGFLKFPKVFSLQPTEELNSVAMVFDTCGETVVLRSSHIHWWLIVPIANGFSIFLVAIEIGRSSQMKWLWWQFSFPFVQNQYWDDLKSLLLEYKGKQSENMLHSSRAIYCSCRHIFWNCFFVVFDNNK